MLISLSLSLSQRVGKYICDPYQPSMNRMPDFQNEYGKVILVKPNNFNIMFGSFMKEGNGIE
jgi:hypothetical protein